MKFKLFARGGFYMSWKVLIMWILQDLFLFYRWRNYFLLWEWGFRLTHKTMEDGKGKRRRFTDKDTLRHRETVPQTVMQVSWAQPVFSRLTCAERTGVSVSAARRQLIDSPCRDTGDRLHKVWGGGDICHACILATTNAHPHEQHIPLSCKMSWEQKVWWTTNVLIIQYTVRIYTNTHSPDTSIRPSREALRWIAEIQTLHRPALLTAERQSSSSWKMSLLWEGDHAKRAAGAKR